MITTKSYLLMTTVTFLLPAIANLVFGLAAIPLYIRLAKAKNIVDTPNHRSSHTTVTPRGGGIFLAFGTILLAGLSSLWLTDSNVSWPFLATALCIAILGLIDDLKPLPSILRLGIQIALAAGLFALLSENLQSAIFNFQPASDTPFIWIIGACCVVWAVGCLNIYNFMDGIDGIATLQGMVASLTWGIIAYSTNDQFTLFITLLLLGGLLAFLRYNWPPAKIFMGDCASSFLGFAFAALPLLHSKHTGTDLWLSINLGALILFPFLFDGAYTLSRRAFGILIENSKFKIGRLPRLIELTQAHRSHLYQRWTQSGASHKYVSCMFGIWALIAGSSALLVHFDYITLIPAYIIVLVPGIALLNHSRKFPK